MQGSDIVHVVLYMLHKWVGGKLVFTHAYMSDGASVCMSFSYFFHDGMMFRWLATSLD